MVTAAALRRWRNVRAAKLPVTLSKPQAAQWRCASNRRMPPTGERTAWTFSVDVTGAATMLALDDGDHYTATLPTDNPKRLHHGRLLAILRAARKAGEVAVTLRSPTLGTIRATYRTKPSDAALNL